MAQWVVETTTVPTGKDNESDWHEHASRGRKSEALAIARKLRKSSSPKTRVRTRIDYARGGMAG